MSNLNSVINQEIKSKFVNQNVAHRCNHYMELYFKSEGNEMAYYYEVENVSYLTASLNFDNSWEGDEDEKEELKEDLQALHDDLTDYISDIEDGIFNDNEIFDFIKGDIIKEYKFESFTKETDLEDIVYILEDLNSLIEEDIDSLDDAETEYKEVYEWWGVTRSFYNQLQGMGECVIDMNDTYIWGRCTTGQAILLDSVVSLICQDMEILEGQEYSWHTEPVKKLQNRSEQTAFSLLHKSDLTLSEEGKRYVAGKHRADLQESKFRCFGVSFLHGSQILNVSADDELQTSLKLELKHFS